MLVYFLKAQAKIADQPGMMLYGNPPRWHKFNPAVHTDASQIHYHAKKTTEIAAAKEAAKGWTKEHDSQSPSQHIAAMKDKAQAIQAKASASAAITGWKQALLAGKAPTASQAKAAAELAATNPTKAQAVLKEVIDAIGADKAQALINAGHAQAHKQTAQEAQAAVATKDAALQEAIDHLEEDSGQGDLPKAEQQEDAALVDKLKAAVGKPKTKAQPKPAPDANATVQPAAPPTSPDTSPPQPQHTFTNAKEGLEAYVTPGVGPSQGKWRVTLKDLDSGETVPVVQVYDSEAAAIASAKEAAGLAKDASTPTPAPTPTVAPAPEAPAPASTKAPLDTAKDVLLAELSTLKLPATNTNAKAVNGKIAKLEALVQAGDHAALTSEKFGSNNYQKKLAKFAAKAASALEGAKQPAAAGADPDGDWLTELFGPEPAHQVVKVNGQTLTKVATGWEGEHHQVYWPGSPQYVAAELIANGTVDAQALGGMGFQKKAQAVSMAVDQGVDPKKAMNKIMAVSDPLDGPFEGDTHTLNGVTYVLQNGRWHRQFPAEEQPGVTQEMKDAAVEAVYVSKDTWEDIKNGWLDSLSSGAVPTLAQAGSFEVLNPSEQQQVLTSLVGHYAYKLTPDQSMALVKEAHDAGFPNSFAYLADKFMALHHQALQQGAAAATPAAVPPVTVTVSGYKFTKTNGVWKGEGGEEYSPTSMPHLVAELHAGLRPEKETLEYLGGTVLAMVVTDLASSGLDPVKLLNAVFPKGGVEGEYGEGAVFHVGIQDFVLKNGKWQEKTDDAPALDANLPGPAASGFSWEGGSPDSQDLPGWYAAMLAGKTPTKVQHQAFMAFMGEHPMETVELKKTLQNTIGLAQYAAQLKPFSPSQYSQAEKDDILQDWVSSIAHGKQPTAKMALIYDSSSGASKQYWSNMAVTSMGLDPDDIDAIDATNRALDKIEKLQNAALGYPAAGQGGQADAQPAAASSPKTTLKFDGITYTKTPQGTWSTAFGDVDSTKYLWPVLEVLAGQALPKDYLDSLSFNQAEDAIKEIIQAGKKPEEALNAIYPGKNNLLNWPNEGDTKTINGKTYILHNGRWHLMTPTGGGTTDDFSKHLNKLSTMGYTAALMNGKVPTKAQHQAYLDALTAASNAGHNIQQLVNSHNDLINATIGKQAHDDLKLQMHAEHNTVVSPAAPTVVLTQPLTAEPDDSESWAFDTSMQMGSNHGGLYTDKNGQQWYVKVPKSEAHARNELLAAKLYEAAGVAVPTLKLVKSNGKVAIASQWVDGMQKVGAGIKSATGALEGFAVDAWLANYDSVGTGYDNLLKDKDGEAVRIDVGGSLLFRAQGALKTDFGDQVNELQSMLNPSINSYSAAVFGGISDDQIKAGVAKVAAITPDQIKQMVQQYGPGTAAEKAALADKIIARRTDLLKKHPVAPAKPAQPAVTSASADTSWHQAIKDGLDAVLPAKNNIKYKATAAKVEKFKKLLDAQDYATIANTEWGKISYGFQIQLFAKKVAKQVAAQTTAPQTAAQPATPQPPPFDPSKLGAPPDFMNWGGSGNPGPSSVLAVNQANQEATQAIYAAAQTGDPEAVKAVEGKLVDKATGQVTGTTPVLQHPSQHISGFAQQMVNEIEEQKTVKKAFVWAPGQSALEAIDKMSDVIKDFATKAVKKVGYFIEVSKPGVVGQVSDLIKAAKVTWKSGQLTEQTYAQKAQQAYAKIPQTQLQALKSYTGNKYHEINQSLWKGNPVGAAKAAEKALHTYGHEVKEGTVLSRKIDLYGNDLQDFLKSAGTCLQEPAVMSTSLSPGEWSGNVHLKLHVGPGVKGLYVGYGSMPGGGAISVNASEKELLLPPNTRLYIVNVKKVSGTTDADGFGTQYLAEAVVLPTKPL